MAVPMSIYTREGLLDLEARRLAPYAISSATAPRRRHEEAPHRLRTAFQRDRDRVIHSRAFRRLEYKTQVWVTGTNDHFRTRLTHTIEVAGITRTLARVLGLNEDLAETIALAHDLGHPPFGHCGERELDRLMSEHGGFDHNLQALTVVDELELKYPGYRGLNLCWETRAGLCKHRGQATVLDGETLPPQPSLEAQVADLADDLTYLCHDVDDGIGAGLIDDEDLGSLHIWRLARERAADYALKPTDERYYPIMVRTLIDLLVAEVAQASAERLGRDRPDSPETAQQLDAPLIAFPDELRQPCRAWREFMFERVYWHPDVDSDNQLAVRWTRELFHHYLKSPADLGKKARQRIETIGLERTVADYIAGMTDRYAIEEHRRLL